MLLWKDFHKIWFLSIFQQSVEKIKASFKCDKNNRRFTWITLDIFFIICRLLLLRMRNVSDKICAENQTTHFIFNNFFFPKIVPLWDKVEKYCRAVQATDDNMAHAHCILPTNTHSEYVIFLLSHNNNGCMNAPQCYVIRTLTVFLVLMTGVFGYESLWTIGFLRDLFTSIHVSILYLRTWSLFPLLRC